jgi:hypothetical protein
MIADISKSFKAGRKKPEQYIMVETVSIRVKELHNIGKKPL